MVAIFRLFSVLVFGAVLTTTTTTSYPIIVNTTIINYQDSLDYQSLNVETGKKGKIQRLQRDQVKNSGKIKLRYFGRKVSTVGKRKSKSIIKKFFYTIEFIKWKLGFNGEKKPPEPDDDEEDDDLQLLLTCLLMVVIVGVFFLLCCYVMPTFFYHFWAYFGFLSSSSSGNDDSTSPKISKNGKQQNRSNSNNEPETAFETEVLDGTAKVAITTTKTTETETEEEGKEKDKKTEKRKKKKRTVKKAKRLARLPVAPVAKTPGQHRSSTETEATLQQKKRGKNLGMPHFLVNSTPLVVPISQVGAAGMMLKMLPTPVVKKSPPPPSPPLPQKKKTPTSPPQKKKAPASPPKKMIAKGKRATSSIGDQLKKAKEKMRMAAPIPKTVKRRLKLLNFKKSSAGTKTAESEDEDEMMAKNGSKVLMKFKSPGKGEKEGEVTQKMIILKGQQQKKEMGMIKTIKTGSPSTGPSSSSSPPASVANRRQWSPVGTSEEHHLVASVTSGILPKNSTFSTPSSDTDNTTN